MMIDVIRVLVAVGAATAIAFGLVMLARATFKRHGMRGTGDVETAYVAAVSTLYGIFIAFMVFIVWTKYDDARRSVAAEANAVAEVYRLAGGQDSPMNGRIRGLALEYAHSVIEHEWDTMRHGKPSVRTEKLVNEMWTELNRMGPDNVKDEVIRDHLLTSWSKATDLRRLRLLWCSTGFASVGYALLIVGGLITLGIACLFTVDDLTTHVIKASAMAALIALMMMAIWGLDHPFSSGIRIRRTPFADALRLLSLGDSRSAPSR